MTSTLARITRWFVSTSVSRPWYLITFVILMAAVSAFYASQNFSVRTDLDALISRDVPWRKAEARLERAFPSQGDDLTVLVEGSTPEQAETAAQTLTDELQKQSDKFISIRRQDGGEYLSRQALLFQPLAEVRLQTARLVSAQPLLGPLATDPSLRGLASALTTVVKAADGDASKTSDLMLVLDTVDTGAERATAGHPATVSWLRLLSGGASDPADLRRIVQLTPKLDQNSIDPGSKPLKIVRTAWRKAGLSQTGARIRVTGSVAMAADELSTLGEMTGFIATLSLVAMAIMVYLAVKSVRLVAVILVTVGLGLVITTAFGLAIFHRFTLISVAFLPLFAGLGIDFALQFAIRFRFEQHCQAPTKTTLVATGFKAGPGIFLAAASVAVGFFAFWPTSYRGVSELGLIAGVGMGTAALATLTLLPAVMVLARDPRSTTLRNIRAWRLVIARRSGWGLPILGVAAAACLLSVVNLPNLRFDFDPLALRNPATESVSAFVDLSRSLDTTPNTMEALAPSAAAASTLAQALRASPEIGRVVTALDLVPPDQAEKLSLISDAKSILEFSLDPFDTPPAPSDGETVSALQNAVSALTTASQGGGEATLSERRLATTFTRLISADASQRSRVATALTGSLPAAIAQLRLALSPTVTTLDALPADLRRDWIAPDGQWRVEIFPKTASTKIQALASFVRAVSRADPSATGTPATVMEAGSTVLRSFIQAALISTLVITALVGAVLRSVRGALLATLPIVATLLLTLGTCVGLGQAINLENLLALPLLLGLGTSFNIYTVMAWRDGAVARVKQNLSRAIFYSGLTTATAFSALILSAHPGTASLGWLLTISLFWTLVTALIILPALLSRLQSSTTAINPPA